MKTIKIIERNTMKDVTAFVTLAIRNGEYRVIDALGIDVTEHMYFGVED